MCLARLFQRHRPRECIYICYIHTHGYHVYVYIDTSIDRVRIHMKWIDTDVSACARITHTRWSDACIRARLSDECHRSISRRGWNFWPSREVREGDKGKRIRDRERKKGEREDRKIEGRMCTCTCIMHPHDSVVGVRVTTTRFYLAREPMLTFKGLLWLALRPANRWLVFLEASEYHHDRTFEHVAHRSLWSFVHLFLRLKNFSNLFVFTYNRVFFNPFY